MRCELGIGPNPFGHSAASASPGLMCLPFQIGLEGFDRLLRRCRPRVAGEKELLVISQDTSAYGVDVKYAASP